MALRRSSPHPGPIYLDYQATTPVDPHVLDRMLPYFRDCFGNAASPVHFAGRRAQKALETAREQVARSINCSSNEIVFTSGATEANNLAVKGAIPDEQISSAHVVTVATEHKSVLEPVQHLAKLGAEVTVLPVGRDGLVSPEDVEGALRPHTRLVSMMFVNNEVGVIQPVEKIGFLLRSRNIPFHTDATQAAGRLSIDVEHLNVDLMSLSAHKVYGPQGIGALFVRSLGIAQPSPQSHGGGQERGLRSGTTNLPGVVGFGAAMELAEDRRSIDTSHAATLGELLKELLLAGLPNIKFNAAHDWSVAGTISVCFSGIDSDVLLTRCPDLAIASGSACTSAVPGPSHVLAAMGLSVEEAEATVRISIGRPTTQEEIQAAADILIAAVTELREMNQMEVVR